MRIAEKLETVEVRTAYKDKTEHTYQNIKVNIKQGSIQCNNFPFIILTSNGERDFPPAFLRRCLRLDIKEPSKEELENIVKAHFLDKNNETEFLKEAEILIEEFLKQRDNQQELATDQLLNAIYIMTRKYAPEGQNKDELIKQLFKSLNP